MIKNKSKEALFFLEYSKAGKNEGTYINASAIISLADCHYERTKDITERGSTRFNDSIVASQIFEYLRIPEDLWDRKGLLIAQAYYNKLAKDSRITVPGYISETFFGDDEITSKVVSIPRNDKERIEKKLLKMGLNGEIKFW